VNVGFPIGHTHGPRHKMVRAFSRRPSRDFGGRRHRRWLSSVEVIGVQNSRVARHASLDGGRTLNESPRVSVCPRALSGDLRRPERSLPDPQAEVGDRPCRMKNSPSFAAGVCGWKKRLSAIRSGRTSCGDGAARPVRRLAHGELSVHRGRERPPGIRDGVLPVAPGRRHFAGISARNTTTANFSFQGLLALGFSRDAIDASAPSQHAGIINHMRHVRGRTRCSTRRARASSSRRAAIARMPARSSTP